MAANSSLSFLSHFQYCSNPDAAVIMTIVYICIKFFLLLPLSLLVLYLGHRRWRQQRSFATASHSDIFTYYSAAMELIFVLGVGFSLCGLIFGLSKMMISGSYLTSITLPVQTCFHVLTCVERYLAVSHPIIYLGLRQSGGVQLRNISIGCVGLLCFGWIGVTAFYYPNTPYIPYFCLLALSLVVASFCSLSVLCVLIRPGPGEVGKDRAYVDQSKRKAFHTITAILGVLWLCFFGFLVCLALDNSRVLSHVDQCLVLLSGNFLTLPSSLVLPLLFLQRTGKLFTK